MTENPTPDTSAELATALARVIEPAPHLRWRIAPAGAPLAEGELACADLAADPDLLAATVAATAAGRGSDDPQVLASLWWQAYAYRVAGTALACWLLTGVAPDVRVAATAVGVARSRPSSVVYLTSVDPGGARTDVRTDAPGGERVASAGTGSGPSRARPSAPWPAGSRDDDSRSPGPEAGTCGGRTSPPRDPSGGSHGLASPALDAFVARLFPGHLDRVAASLRARHRLGVPLVWGDVAAACASAAGAVLAVAGPDGPRRLAEFLDACPHDLRTLGRWTWPAPDAPARNHHAAPRPDQPDQHAAPDHDPVRRAGTGAPDRGPTPAPGPPPAAPTFRRTTCCLWWKTSAAAGAICADCSLDRSPIATPDA